MAETLKQLHESVKRMQHLDAMLQELYAQRQELIPKVQELDTQRMKEKADVDRLEGRTLVAFFYGVIGRMDERLDRERAEAYEASVRYDTAARELSFVESSIQQAEMELEGLKGCEGRYEQLLAQKTEELKSAGGESGRKIMELERQLMDLESERKELREAIHAGQAALETAGHVMAELEEASSWSTFDLMGGGILTDMIKHEHMDAAQNEVERLQIQLRSFKTELADVHVHLDVQVRLDDFMRFADYFFDGLFADWAVRDQIKRSQAAIDQTYGDIQRLLDRLGAMDESAEARRCQFQRELDELVVERNS